MIRSITLVSTIIELKAIKIWNKGADFLAFVENVECRLLSEWNLSQPKLHDQCIFVGLLNYPVAKCVKDLDCAANNLKDFVLEQ